jgi:YebC/PmpR family DNA-binding regulatory protein
MAGHSKFANIRHRKGAQDVRRAKIFTKLIREITVAAKIAADPNSNPRLRLAVDKALSQNMSRDTIDRAIKRGAGGGDQDQLEEIRYEGYGPGGVAIMVDCLTDNRNRTVSEVRHAFSKAGGNLGSDGSVAYLFKKLGRFYFPAEIKEEQLMELALEQGAEDVIQLDTGEWEVHVSPENYAQLQKSFIEAKLQPEQSEISMIAALQVKIEDEDAASSLLKMLDVLEDLDDVQEVYSNAEIAEALVEKLS